MRKALGIRERYGSPTEVLGVLEAIARRHDFETVVLFGSFQRLLSNWEDDALSDPRDIDLLVGTGMVGTVPIEMDAERTKKLDALCGDVEAAFGIPCALHAFDGQKPSDLVGLLAMRDGHVLCGARSNVSDGEIAAARNDLYEATAEILESLRTSPVSHTVLVPRSRHYNVGTLRDMMETLVRYENLEMDRAEAEYFRSMEPSFGR